MIDIESEISVQSFQKKYQTNLEIVRDLLKERIITRPALSELFRNDLGMKRAIQIMNQTSSKHVDNDLLAKMQETIYYGSMWLYSNQYGIEWAQRWSKHSSYLNN